MKTNFFQVLQGEFVVHETTDRADAEGAFKDALSQSFSAPVRKSFKGDMAAMRDAYVGEPLVLQQVNCRVVDSVVGDSILFLTLAMRAS